MTKTQSTPVDSSKLSPRFLSVKFGTSKAADSYGYNRVTLTDTSTGRKFSCVGGGYDMTGTVLGEWMEATLQDRLDALTPGTKSVGPYPRRLYGIYYKGEMFGSGYVTPRTSVDGACGMDSMLDICRACGIEVERVYDRSSLRAKHIGFQVSLVEVAA